MNTASWEQIKSMLQSMSKVLFGNIASVKKKADDAQQAAANAQAATDAKMNAVNPKGEGSFAMNSTRTPRGAYSFTEGRWCLAGKECAHAEGEGTDSFGQAAHSEGRITTARGDYSHAEGEWTKTLGDASHAEGLWTTAVGKCQHVQGKYNVLDNDYASGEKTFTRYAHIVGNGVGDADSLRSNAYTLDWDGNGWFAGTVEGTGLILKSSTTGSEKRFLITVNDSGSISAAELTEA